MSKRRTSTAKRGYYWINDLTNLQGHLYHRDSRTPVGEYSIDSDGKHYIAVAGNYLPHRAASRAVAKRWLLKYATIKNPRWGRGPIGSASAKRANRRLRRR